jgi:hypothetical protein
MPAQLLIYESAVPVAQGRHGQRSVEVGADYAFTKSVNSVPLTAVEFAHAASEYAIVFAGTGDTVVPAVILGMREGENLYLGGEGGWKAKYIPAFVRRYPFVFASSEDGKTFTLCIDESYRGVNQEGRGQRLFDGEGKPTPYVQNVLKFLEQYQVEYRRTEVLCRKLRELNLLEPMRVEFNLGSGDRLALSGFMAVARDRIKTLSTDTLAELVRTDQLELVYVHLQSLRNFSAMTGRLTGAAPAPEERLHGPTAQEQAAKTTRQRAAKQDK